jgi:protein-S-isoprenylcysteine O-methyltransferase Ste14
MIDITNFSGNLLLYGFTTIALVSCWALIGSGLIFILILFRIFIEEKYLSENLEGYKEYLRKTRYILVPGIW